MSTTLKLPPTMRVAEYNNNNTKIFFSYATPIAIFDEDTRILTLTKEGFSSTTQKHKNKVIKLMVPAMTEYLEHKTFMEVVRSIYNKTYKTK